MQFPADPLISLIVASLLIAASVMLFWPERGLFWRIWRALRADERVLIEDALKHYFDCEYKHRAGTLQSLMGALEISGHKAAEIVRLLEERELIQADGTGYQLTPAGRSYALRIVRIHRLWESYLSDRTGFDPMSWHSQAEQREHTTSKEEADALSASIGHPRYDPHGDPIPTSSGDIVPPEGVPLTELAAGAVAQIVHIEDEPEAVYAQLLAEGLHPGMQILIAESTPQRIRFQTEAEEHLLAPVLAANISALPLPEEERFDERSLQLSRLRPGEEGRVVAISPAVRGQDRRRLFDLGLIPGTTVSAELKSPLGETAGYRIRGAVIALRREQTDLIHIRREADAA